MFFVAWDGRGRAVVGIAFAEVVALAEWREGREEGVVECCPSGERRSPEFRLRPVHQFYLLLSVRVGGFLEHSCVAVLGLQWDWLCGEVGRIQFHGYVNVIDKDNMFGAGFAAGIVHHRCGDDTPPAAS